MLEFTFTAQSPLGGYQKDFDSVSISEVTNRAIVSIAIPLGGEVALAEAFSKAYGAEIPKLGYSTTADLENSKFLGMQQDLMFYVFDCEQPNALKSIKDKLGGCGHLTDQSDSWVMLMVSGLKSREALARICPVNLHPDIFSEDRVVRTLMEHLGVVIFRDGPDSFVLLAPRSSAESFLRTVNTSISNVVGCDQRVEIPDRILSDRARKPR